MASNLRGRLWSLLLIVVPLVGSMLIASPARADEVITNQNQVFNIPYNCLSGQQLVFTPGQIQVNIVDGTGATIGQDQLVSAFVDILPSGTVVDTTGRRTQGDVYSAPTTITSFTQETGLPLNGNKSLYVEFGVQWNDVRGVPEYLSSTIDCSGTPLDSDGDGVPDDLDQCPAVSGNGSANGCPQSAQITVTNVQPAHSADGVSGSVTVTITNPVDNGVAESYVVEGPGPSFTTPALADGATSGAMTFSQAPAGEQQVCASGSQGGPSSCVAVTVPDNPQRAHEGKLVFVQACDSLHWTITNTGYQTTVYYSRVDWEGPPEKTYVWSLAPGQSASGTTPRYFYTALVQVTMRDEAGNLVPNSALGNRHWTQPSGCNPPMTGGDELLSWGKVTKRAATPKVTMRTKAYTALYGYQVKGRSTVTWFAQVSPGTRTLSLLTLKVPRHHKRVVRIWVSYLDANHSEFGTHVLTGWHTYRRR